MSKINPSTHAGKGGKGKTRWAYPFTPSRRRSFEGATRGRDTQVRAGHPLTGLWTSWTSMTRSHRPDVRTYARKKLASQPAGVIWDEIAGVPGE